LCHVLAQVVGFGGVGGAPDLLEELALGDELAGIADEDVDELPLGRGEVYGVMAGLDGVVGQVDGVAADAGGDRAVFRAARGGAPAAL